MFNLVGQTHSFQSHRSFNSAAPAINFPADPTGTPSGTVDYSRIDFDHLTNMSLTGMENVFTNFLTYINAHPGSWEAYIDMTKAYATVYKHFQEMGQPVPASLVNFLQRAGAMKLMTDGIETAALFAYKNGYGGLVHEDAYKSVFSQWISVLQGLPGYTNDPILNGLAGPDGLLVTDLGLADKFNESHYDTVTGRYGFKDVESGSWFYFDADPKVDPNAAYTIDTLILFHDKTGDDLATLEKVMAKLTSLNLMDTIDEILRSHGSELAIFMILAFMMGAELGYLNQVDGNNDTQNQQHELNTRYIASLQNALTGLGNWKTSPNDKDGLSAHQLRQSLIGLLANQGQNGTQFGSLDSVTDQLREYLMSNSVPSPAGATDTTATLYNLIVKGTDDSGKAISDNDLAVLLKSGLAPNTTSPSAGAPATNPNPQMLQGFIGSLNSLGTSVSSTSTQLTTLSSQIAQILQALYKVGTGVVDPKNGLLAVSQTAINKSGN